MEKETVKIGNIEIEKPLILGSLNNSGEEYLNFISPPTLSNPSEGFMINRGLNIPYDTKVIMTNSNGRKVTLKHNRYYHYVNGRWIVIPLKKIKK
jgi:hypothetical protein